MAERNTIQQRPAKSNRIAPVFTFLQKIQTHAPASTFLQKIHSHAPNTTHLLGFSILFFVSISTLLILTATILGFVFFMPLIIVSMPIWLPICALLLLTAAGFLSACAFGVTLAAGSTWMYRYFRGVHPPGADRVDSARIRIYDTVSHVKDCVIECGTGGYLQNEVKDPAPDA